MSLLATALPKLTTASIAASQAWLTVVTPRGGSAGLRVDPNFKMQHDYSRLHPRRELKRHELRDFVRSSISATEHDHIDKWVELAQKEGLTSNWGIARLVLEDFANPRSALSVGAVRDILDAVLANVAPVGELVLDADDEEALERKKRLQKALLDRKCLELEKLNVVAGTMVVGRGAFLR